MKKITKARLHLDRETIAPLLLDAVVGGNKTGDVTGTRLTTTTHPTKTSSPIHTCNPPTFACVP